MHKEPHWPLCKPFNLFAWYPWDYIEAKGSSTNVETGLEIWTLTDGSKHGQSLLLNTTRLTERMHRLINFAASFLRFKFL